MAQITGGKITYGRTTQPAQYESKRADCEIEFVVGEGEDYTTIASEAEAFAVGKVHEMLGIRGAPPAGPAPTKVVTPAKTSAAMDTTPVTTTADEQKAAAAAARKAEKDKKDAAAKPKVAKPPTEKPAETGAAISNGGERINPEDDLGDGDVELADDDGLDEDGLPKEPVKPVVVTKEITDAELTSAITRVNVKLNNAARIRELVAEFVGPAPANSKTLTQAQRPLFIEALEKLIK